MTDNAKNFTSTAFADALAERHVKHRRTRPYRPQTNGEVCEYRGAGVIEAGLNHPGTFL